MGPKEMKENLDVLNETKNELEHNLKGYAELTSKSQSAEEQAKINKSIEKDTKELEEVKQAIDGYNKKLELANAELEAAKKFGMSNLEETVETDKDYINSEKAVLDFAKTIQEAHKTGQDIKSLWAKHVTSNGLVTKAITNPGVLVPEPIVREIKEKFNYAAKDLQLATWHFGTDRWASVYNDSEDIGLGDNRADKAETKKTQQNLNFVKRSIIAEYVYKYITIDRKLARAENAQVILDYVKKELPEKVAYAIERAMWIGDGLADSAETKIQEDVIIPMGKDSAEYVTALTTDELNEDTLGVLEEDIVERPGMMLVAKMHKKTYGVLKRLRVDGEKAYDAGTIVLGGMTFNTLDGIIISTGQYMPLLADSTDELPAIIMANMPSYEFVTPTNEVEYYTNFLLSTNQQEFLAEQDVAGALLSPLSASKLSLTGGTGE